MMRRRRPGRPRGRAGFSLVELLSAMVMVGILASIAIPRLRGPIAKADVAKIQGDFHSVRHAAYDYLAENGRFPRSGSWGTVPTELQGNVPDFDYKGLDYLWTAIDLRGLGGSFFGFNQLGLFYVRFNGNVEISEAMRARQGTPLNGFLNNYYWSATYAIFVIAE